MKSNSNHLQQRLLREELLSFIRQICALHKFADFGKCVSMSIWEYFKGNICAMRLYVKTIFLKRRIIKMKKKVISLLLATSMLFPKTSFSGDFLLLVLGLIYTSISS